MVGRLIKFSEGELLNLQEVHPWKINGWNIMEVWFGRSFSFPKRVYFAGIPAVKLPKAFFSPTTRHPKSPGWPSLGISHHQVSHLCDQSNTGAAGGSSRTWMTFSTKRRRAVGLVAKNSKKKPRKSQFGMLCLSKMNNYWGCISLSGYHGGNLRI